MPNTDERLSRTHIILADRLDQIKLNLAAVAGGRPYIDERLSRLPFESDTSWNGVGKEGGRSARAFLINYAGRIATKINQYVFATEVKRTGADPGFLADTTRTGLSITETMRRASEIVTAARWGWISVDRNSLPRDAAGNPVERSVAAKEASGDRVFWSVWEPGEVVDWHFDVTGKLLWVITEQYVYDNSDLLAPAVNKPVRTIWQQGGGVRLWLNPENREKIDLEETFTSSLPEVGFVPIGTPSISPWWFDDVEGIQAAILNLESVHNENLYQTAFPQLILPDSMLQTIMGDLKISGDEALEKVRGLKYPILEPLEANGITRYLMPSAGMEKIPDNILRLVKELFETVGMALKIPSSQIQSAESKAFDHLDTEAVLKERATLLEEAETKAVILSKKLDPTFKAYTPTYCRSFNVQSVAEEIAALIQFDAMKLPFEAQKELMRAAVEVFARTAKIPADRKAKILASIEALTPTPG